MRMATVELPKMEKEPIGKELSIDAGKFKDIKKYKVGDKGEFKISAVIVGQHFHSIGKNKQHMYDIKITDFECYEEDEDEDDGEDVE